MILQILSGHLLLTQPGIFTDNVPVCVGVTIPVLENAKNYNRR